MKKRQRPLIIRAAVAIFFIVLPQALIWLHKAEQHGAVLALALISTLIIAFAALKVLSIIFVLTPQGFALCGEQMNRKSPFVFVFGTVHIAYALYQIGWTHVSITLLVLMGITEVFSLIGRIQLAKLDGESRMELWTATRETLRKAEQDAAPQIRPR
ncbi:MAG: hypothetical protein ACSHYB_10700 [Roseibacillus sp.]